MSRIRGCREIDSPMHGGCREIDSSKQGRYDSCESYLPLKIFPQKEKKMANDNHLFSVTCYNVTMQNKIIITNFLI